MDIGAIIIGDELLSGKRQDKHFPKLLELLKARGMELAWVSYLGDDPKRISEALRRSFASEDLVFSFGGIGATPDDRTRACAAAALDVPLIRHPEAVAEIEARFGADANPKRVLMAEFPLGAKIIPNPYNRIPGFSLGHHYFVPGFPEMAWPMLEWVLDTNYRHLHHRAPQAEESVVAYDAMEGQLIDTMNALLTKYPGIKVSSLPSFTPGGRIIELGVKGDPAAVPAAMAEMIATLELLGLRYERKA